MNKELLYRRAKASIFPPLKVAGEWVLDAKKKANALARACQAKSSLPQPALGPKQELEKVEARMPEFILIRSRIVLRILKALKLDTASGPDGIPVRDIASVAASWRLLLRFWYDICFGSAVGRRSGDCIEYRRY